MERKKGKNLARRFGSRVGVATGVLGLTAAALAGGEAMRAREEVAVLRDHKAGLAAALERQSRSARDARRDRSEALFERDAAANRGRRSLVMFTSALNQAEARRLAGREVKLLSDHLTDSLTRHDNAIRRLQQRLQRGKLEQEDLARAHSMLGELKVMSLVFAAHGNFLQSQGAEQLHNALSEALENRGQYVR